MKAAFVKTKGKVELRELPTPTPGAGEVVLRIAACGVCGSDLIEASHWAKDWKRFGHELTGQVHALGQGVSGFAEGDKVALALSAPCGECVACKKGLPRHCTQMIVAEQGGFAEYLLVGNTRLLRKVPDAIPENLLCLVEPLTVILDAFEVARLNKEQDALFVAGGGFLGTVGILAAHALGVPIAGIMARQESDGVRKLLDLTGGAFVKWPAARRPHFGEKALLPMPELQGVLGGHAGRTVVLHTASPKAIPNYIQSLPYAATVVNIGLSGNGAENRIKLDGGENVFKRIQLLSAFPVPCLTIDAAINLLARNVEIFSHVQTRTITLEELPKFIRSPVRGAKTIVSMDVEAAVT